MCERTTSPAKVRDTMTLELKATTDHHADVGATVRPATIEIAEVSDRETWDGLMAAAPAPHLPWG